ncbi:condensation protein [Streptomyces sp. NPDC059008]|uniref:condensation protein n=1 Tax=Streptomyces sp. NPDC059008 TaxID=3346693 RepID=UPI0036C6AF70
MTALQPAAAPPPSSSSASSSSPSVPRSGPRPARQPTVARVPFPLVDEVSRHCLEDDEPETVHIEVHLPGRIEPARLRTAFHQALARHPRILMRQEPVRWWRRRYLWELTAAPDVDPVAVAPPGPDALRHARERALSHCPPLDASPPVRLEIVGRQRTGTADGTVLLLTINHTALDGPACLRVLATAAELYGGADNSPAPPPVRAAGPGTEHPDDETAPGSVGRRFSRPARVATDTDTDTTDKSNGMLITELPVPARPPRVGGRTPYTVNDQLLVATCLMVSRWNRLHAGRTAPVVVTMPVDDRPRDIGMPIGNGTRLVSVGFGPEERQDAELLTADPPDPDAVARLLRRTAARTRALKSAPPGPQLGLSGAVLTAPVLPVGLRGAATRALRAAAAPWTSTTLLSNIGRIPYPLDFGDAGRPTAVWFSAPARMPRGLTVTTVSVGGRIQLALRWSHALLDDPAGARLGALFRSSLAATAWPDPAAPPPPEQPPPPPAAPTEGRAR